MTRKPIEALIAYCRRLAESDEQPNDVRQVYAQALHSLGRLGVKPTRKMIEAIIDKALGDARKCAGTATPHKPDSLYRRHEKARKFRPGIPTITHDKWIEKPELPPCWKGDFREWHIDGVARNDAGDVIEKEAPGHTGEHYQNQLYCRFWECFISPAGLACEHCRQRMFPNVERWRTHVLPGIAISLGVEAARNVLVAAVERGELTEEDALEVAQALGLE